MRKNFLVTIVVLLQILIIAAGTSFVLLKLYPVEPISKTDLMDIAVDKANITMRMPKQWQKVDLGEHGGIAFGNKIGGEQSSGLVQIIDGGTTFTRDATKAPAHLQDEYRDQAYDQIDKWAKDTASCTDRKVFRKEKDVSSQDGILGLFRFDMTCKKPTGRMVTMAVRLILTDDSHFRVVFITAHRSNWNTNKDVYEIMLRSIKSKIAEGDLTSAIKNVMGKAWHSAGIASSPIQFGIGVYKNVPEYAFAVPSTSDATFAMMGQVQSSIYPQTLEAVRRYFTDHGYKESDNGKAPVGKSFAYDNRTISCVLSEWGLSSVVGEGDVNTLLLRCATTEDFIKNAKAIKPFYELIAADDEVDRSTIHMNEVKVKPSKTPGYNTLEGGLVMRTVDGATNYSVAMFYQSPGSTKWNLVYRTMGGAYLCTDIPSPHAREAFSVADCLESDKQTKRAL